MNTIYKNTLCALVGVGMVACSDFLDVEPHNQLTDAAVWGNLDYAEAFLNNCYSWVEGENQMVCLSVVIRMKYIIVRDMQRKCIL